MHQRVKKGSTSRIWWDIDGYPSGANPTLTLVLPDGTAVAPEATNFPNISGSDDGVTTDGISMTFLVDADAAGDYTLRFTAGSWFVGDDGVDQGTLEFTLP